MPEPLFISPRTRKSFWQEYRVYSDRIELECKVALQTLKIPREDVLDIQIRPPLVFVDLFRGKSFAYAFPLKIDASDAHRHIALQRKSGFIKYLRFTPEDPDAFFDACQVMRAN